MDRVDFLFKVFVKMYICQINIMTPYLVWKQRCDKLSQFTNELLSCSASSSSSDIIDNREHIYKTSNAQNRLKRLFVFNDHVIYKVEVCGIVIMKYKVNDKERYSLYIDDSTGVINCSIWKNNKRFYNKAHDSYQPGVLCKVKGNVTNYNGRFSICVIKIVEVYSCESEALFHLSLVNNRKELNNVKISESDIKEMDLYTYDDKEVKKRKRKDNISKDEEQLVLEMLVFPQDKKDKTQNTSNNCTNEIHKNNIKEKNTSLPNINDDSNNENMHINQSNTIDDNNSKNEINNTHLLITTNNNTFNKQINIGLTNTKPPSISVRSQDNSSSSTTINPLHKQFINAFYIYTQTAHISYAIYTNGSIEIKVSDLYRDTTIREMLSKYLGTTINEQITLLNELFNSYYIPNNFGSIIFPSCPSSSHHVIPFSKSILHLEQNLPFIKSKLNAYIMLKDPSNQGINITSIIQYINSLYNNFFTVDTIYKLLEILQNENKITNINDLYYYISN